MTAVLDVTPARRVSTGELIRTARHEAGLTQQQLADRVRSTQSAVARWESGGDVPRLDRLDEVLRACGVELDFRFRRHDDVDRALIRQHLAMTPRQRADAQVAANRFLTAGQIDRRTQPT